MGYRYAEDGPTADLTVETWGSTIEEAFANVAKAAFNAMTPIEGIEGEVSRAFEIEGDDLGLLLFNFIDELLYIHEVELLVFSRFELEIDREEFRLRAVCTGEPFDLERHPQGIAIKAVTFHEMSIEEGPERWSIRIVLDT
ncbi:MAG TPA: archease [Patescibacteria group bacterium]|nr:archease [Patescibacteria group bacterium]